MIRIELDLKTLLKKIESGDYEFIYELIAHELDHVVSRNAAVGDRLALTEVQQKNGEWLRTVANSINQKMYNGFLLELIVSRMSARTIYNTDEKENNPNTGERKVSAYTATKEILNMMECAYGITEKELLSSSVHSRIQIAKLCADKVGKDSRTVLKEIDKFEYYYSTLHKITYENLGQEMSMEEEYSSIQQSLVSIYNLCEEIISDRIARKPVDDLQSAYQFCENTKYDHNMLDKAFSRIWRRYNNHLKFKYGSKCPNLDIYNRCV